MSDNDMIMYGIAAAIGLYLLTRPKTSVGADGTVYQDAGGGAGSPWTGDPTGADLGGSAPMPSDIAAAAKAPREAIAGMRNVEGIAAQVVGQMVGGNDTGGSMNPMGSPRLAIATSSDTRLIAPDDPAGAAALARAESVRGVPAVPNPTAPKVMTTSKISGSGMGYTPPAPTDGTSRIQPELRRVTALRVVGR